MRIQLEPAALPGSLVLWLALALASSAWLFDSLGSGIVFGFFATLLHYLSLLVHHFSHAVAARRTGHPMEAVRIGRLLILGTSVYPADEGELPARVHIQRAIGGPIGSAALALLAGVVAMVVPGSSPLGLYATFLALDSLLVFVLGVFLPLGFTDVSTIMYWWGK